MKKFRWILLSGLLVATTQIAQAQPPGNVMPGAPVAAGAPGAAADAGAISNAPAPANPSGIAPGGAMTDGATAEGGAAVAPDAAGMSADASDSSMPNTGGTPMLPILAGLSIAGAAVAMRRKVAA